MEPQIAHPYTVLTEVKSSSNPNLKYEIRVGGDGRTYCSCPAWRFNHRKDCKHLKAWKGALS